MYDKCDNKCDKKYSILLKNIRICKYFFITIITVLNLFTIIETCMLDWNKNMLKVSKSDGYTYSAIVARISYISGWWIFIGRNLPCNLPNVWPDT